MMTTLNQIRAHRPCHDGWSKLLRGLGKTAADDEVIWLDQILDHNNLDDALWCLRAVENCDREIRLFAVWCARRVQHHMTDPRSVAALDVAERFARGEASDAELEAARGLAAAAWAAAWAAAAAARAAAAALAAAGEWAAAALAAAGEWAAAALAAAGEWAAAALAAAGEWAAAAAARAAAAAEWADRNTERTAQAEELRRVCREMREAQP
jgi:hypothetical protein